MLAHFEEAPGARLPIELSMGAEASTIPTSRYLSRQFYDQEVQALWNRVWQLACRTDQVASPGAYLEYAVADQSFLIVRGKDDKIRAFHNVCRHRGNQIKNGCGTASDLRCAFHQWTWTLEGEVRHIPDVETFDDLDVTNCRLFEVPSGTWAGFVFINPDPHSAARLPLDDFLRPVQDHLGPYRYERFVAVSDQTTSVAANWKVAVEAFLENYHSQGVHPQLLPVVDDVNTCYELFETHSRMLVRMGVPSPRLGPDVEPLEVIAYLPNAFSGPAGTGVTMDYAMSRLRKMIDGLTNDDNEVELRPGTDLEGLIDDMMAPYVDADGRLSLPEGFTSREVLVEMIAGFVSDTGDLRLPVGVTERELFIEMLAAIGRAKGHDYSGLTRAQILDDWHYFIFPNVIINTQAGGFLFIRIRPDQHDHERCFFDAARFLWLQGEKPAPVPHVDVEPYSGSFGVVLDQDLENIPRVQRGLHSSALSHITIGRQETRIAHLHATIDRYLAEANESRAAVTIR
jgi:phenylpropionate dioxygenase-like ring-hydroxylating dioxygenase large terminal subunit